MLRPALRRVTATRYVTPLREGGSMPGLCEADDDGTYVVKFHGAGQGRRVLVAEVLAAALAGALDLEVPELVVADVDPVIGRGEPDEEVQDLLLRSPGANLGMDFLPGALSFDPAVDPVEADWAARVLWFDALVLNVDRSWRNPNALWWGGRPGSSTTVPPCTSTTTGRGPPPASTGRCGTSRTTCCCARRPRRAVDAACTAALTPDVLAAAVAACPRSGWTTNRGSTTGTPSAAPTSTGSPAGSPPRAGAPTSTAPRGRSPVAEAAWTSSSTPSCRWCRAWTGGSSSTPAWCCGAGPGSTSRRGPTSTRSGCARCRGTVDLAAVRRHLVALEGVCAGDPRAGAATTEAKGARFRWLTAPRSTVLQTSPVHCGLTADPAAELDRLLTRLVRPGG